MRSAGPSAMPKVIGITGGIASGKSTVSCYLMSKGYKVVDCDRLAHEAYEDCFEQLSESFPDCVQNNAIDRKLLAEKITRSPLEKKKLEGIIHPYCRQKMTAAIARNHDLLFLDIPLLYEAGMTDLCDEVWVVYIPENLQLKRLMARDHFDEKTARERIAWQMPLAKKKLLADVVLDNSMDKDSLYQKIDERLEAIKHEAG